MLGAGLEPARGCPQGILSPQCLPFHHSSLNEGWTRIHLQLESETFEERLLYFTISPVLDSRELFLLKETIPQTIKEPW
jgi:hypothetical protein